MKNFAPLAIETKFDFSLLTEENLAQFSYIPLLESQEHTVGFGTFNSIDTQTGEDVGVHLKQIQHWLFIKHIEEKKSIPSPKVLKALTQKKLNKMELEGEVITEDTQVAVAEAVKQNAISRAFSKVNSTLLMIDTQKNIIYAEGSLKGAEKVSDLVRQVCGSFPVVPFENTLGDDTPADFYTHIVNPKVNHDLILGSQASFVHPESGAIHTIKKRALDDATMEIEPLLKQHFKVVELQVQDCTKNSFDATYIVNSTLEFKGVKDADNDIHQKDDAGLLLTANLCSDILHSLVGFIKQQ